MTVRLIPERTVDSLLAFELVHALPTGIIWSPSNTRGQWDHAFFAGGRVLIFECKGIISNDSRDPTAAWRAPLDVVQLNNYLQAGIDLTYLLPARPDQADPPWVRSCTFDPDAWGHCSACLGSRRERKDDRRFAGDSNSVASAPEHIRFQPWFNHWAWCIPASSLAHQVAPSRRQVLIDARDSSLQQIPDAQRLCHLLAMATAMLEQTDEGNSLLEPFLIPPDSALQPLVFGAVQQSDDDSDEDELTPPIAISF